MNSKQKFVVWIGCVIIAIGLWVVYDFIKYYDNTVYYSPTDTVWVVVQDTVYVAKYRIEASNIVADNKVILLKLISKLVKEVSRRNPNYENTCHEIADLIGDLELKRGRQK